MRCNNRPAPASPACALKTGHCLEVRNYQSSQAIISGCFTATQVKHGQVLMLCSKADSTKEQCEAAYDHSKETKIKIRTGGAITFQFTTARNMETIEVYRPPTEAGGLETSRSNIFQFSVQCQKQNAAWHTVKTYNSPNKRSPGWVTLNLDDGCLENAVSWRIANIEGHTNEAYVNVFEVVWYSVDIQDDPPVLYPRLIDTAQMSTTDDGKTGRVFVKTVFNATHTLTCLSLYDSDAAGHVVGVTTCGAAFDGNVNSPVIFETSLNEKYTRPSLTVYDSSTYSSIWVYHNPVNDQMLSRRLQVLS